ncbi:metal ABC transporter permease [bacterium]|nr:metal ABC transporter permease [bacterium]
MLELISLYGWTIVAGCLASPTLALIGTQLAARDRAMQTLCVSQGALVGVLLGLGLFQPFDIPVLTSVGPMALALFFSGTTFLLTDKWVASRAASKNTLFAVLFVGLLSCGYLISSIFPALENHLAQVYFGDLATLTEGDSQRAIFLSLIALFFIQRNWMGFSNESFEWALFGCPPSTNSASSRWGFRLLSLLTLSVSVQYVGFLFTVSMLFVPTGLLSLSRRCGLKRHLVSSAILAVLSSGLGFLVSLRFTRMPTVPTIVAALILASTVFLLTERVFDDAWAKFRKHVTWWVDLRKHQSATQS